ncbi:SDR family oxidoreductase [Microvirga sp. TS319]|uniref:SDR family oxidoreductase n=1 Tax=Microvirga sp. TS319 TaxID=3241165 RepID=UPI00351A5CB3
MSDMKAQDLRRSDDRVRSNPVAVVTGSSAGVGRATAIEFGRRGYDVALLARGGEGLEGARRDVEAVGGEVLVIPVDTADCAGMFAAADAILARWRRIDVWVNNAMATVVGPVDRIPASEYKRVTEVTYLGVIHGTLAALRHMRARNKGTIVQIGSALAYRSIPLQSAYCGAKAAIRGFTDSLRTELLHDHSAIRLTMVQLPGVNTPQFDWSRTHEKYHHQPVGACYEPEVVARSIVDAAEEGPRELWVGTPAIMAILGNMVAPGLLDKYLAKTAYDQQLSSKPVRPDDPDILFEPARKDHGVRGRFSSRAKTRLIDADPAHLHAGLALAAVGLTAALFLFGARSVGRRLERAA